MSLDESVVEGTLNADGTLHLDQKPDVKPGRVHVIVQSAAGNPRGGRRLVEVMEEIKRDQKARGYRGRTIEEMQASEKARIEEEDEYLVRCQSLGAAPQSTER
ncbi:MAG: hypothetical protein HYX68_28855 [Planctomycetes bacterium]|jgi:hypothetical protein|nr:hypothetical protein [Planctomycetota bacterium]